MLCHDRCILGLCARCMFRIDLVCVCVGGGGGCLLGDYLIELGYGTQ